MQCNGPCVVPAELRKCKIQELATIVHDPWIYLNICLELTSFLLLSTLSTRVRGTGEVRPDCGSDWGWGLPSLASEKSEGPSDLSSSHLEPTSRTTEMQDPGAGDHSTRPFSTRVRGTGEVRPDCGSDWGWGLPSLASEKYSSSLSEAVRSV
jgi:hypothetical protein